MLLDYFDLTQRTKRQYAQAMEPVCQTFGLTRNEVDVMLFLHNNPGFDRASDIVARRGMTKSHVSLSVTNLESRGLLTRTADPEDRRTVRLALTEGAHEIAQAGRTAQEAFFRELFSGIRREELEQLGGVMEQISHNVIRMEQE